MLVPLDLCCARRAEACSQCSSRSICTEYPHHCSHQLCTRYTQQTTEWSQCCTTNHNGMILQHPVTPPRCGHQSPFPAWYFEAPIESYASR